MPNPIEKLKESHQVEAKQENLESLVSRAVVHAEKLRDHALKFHGKTGYNPYIWLNRVKLTEHLNTLANSKDTTELYAAAAAVLAIKQEDPTITKVEIPSFRNQKK